MLPHPSCRVCSRFEDFITNHLHFSRDETRKQLLQTSPGSPRKRQRGYYKEAVTASAKEISMEAVIARVLSELGAIFALKGAQNAFMVEKICWLYSGLALARAYLATVWWCTASVTPLAPRKLWAGSKRSDWSSLNVIDKSCIQSPSMFFRVGLLFPNTFSTRCIHLFGFPSHIPGHHFSPFPLPMVLFILKPQSSLFSPPLPDSDGVRCWNVAFIHSDPPRRPSRFNLWQGDVRFLCWMSWCSVSYLILIVLSWHSNVLVYPDQRLALRCFVMLHSTLLCRFKN